MITTRSQTSSTSLRRCEFRSTEIPRSRSDSRSERTVRRPAGSSALVGSSSSRSRGEPTRAWAIPSRCCIPFRHLVDGSSARVEQSDEGRGARCARAAPPVEPLRRWCSVEHLVRGRPARETEELGEVPERGSRAACEPAGAPQTSRAPGRLADEAAGDLHERRLARAVRAEEARRARPPRTSTSTPPQGLGLPVALRESAGGEGGGHPRLG